MPVYDIWVLNIFTFNLFYVFWQHIYYKLFLSQYKTKTPTIKCFFQVTWITNLLLIFKDIFNFEKRPPCGFFFNNIYYSYYTLLILCRNIANWILAQESFSRVKPGQVASSSLGWHIETNHKQSHTHTPISTKFIHTRITNYPNVVVLEMGEETWVCKPHKQRINPAQKPSKVLNTRPSEREDDITQPCCSLITIFYKVLCFLKPPAHWIKLKLNWN